MSDSTKDLVQTAKEYATQKHQGQTRKGSGLPYIVHPENVLSYLKGFGINDETLFAIAWLHDTVEDTGATIDELADMFGREVAFGVQYLTRVGKDYAAYYQKLEKAPDSIKLIKICDVIDNVSTLEAIDREGIDRKISECNRYFIPWAERLLPKAAEMIKTFLDRYAKMSTK